MTTEQTPAQRKFGKHVVVFRGRVSGGYIKTYVSVSLKDDLRGDPCYGTWLTVAEAKRLAAQLLKAVEYAEGL